MALDGRNPPIDGTGTGTGGAGLLGFFPGREQELLLRAALLAGEPARQAWEEWWRATDLDRLDPGSFRLLPLLFANLKRLGIEGPLLPRIKGVYRHFWYRNQLFFHQMAGLLEALQRADIPVLLLKGGALALLYYSDPSQRPMADLDLLIRPADRPRALAFLHEKGWTPIYFQAFDELSPSYLSCVTGHGFRHEKVGELDLHWYLLSTCSTGSADAGLWERAVDLDFRGVRCRSLGPTDMLFHICTHGAAWNDIPPIRWAADASLILQRASGAIDWSLLVKLARDQERIPALRDTLGYLRERLDAQVPAAVLDELRALPVPPALEKEYLAQQLPLSQRSPFLELWLAFRQYRRWLAREGVAGGPITYLRVLQHTAKRRSLRELWHYALHRGWERWKAKPAET